MATFFFALVASLPLGRLPRPLHRLRKKLVPKVSGGSISMRGGYQFEVSPDEKLIYEAYIIARGGLESVSPRRLAKVLWFRCNTESCTAVAEWLAPRLHRMIERGIFIQGERGVRTPPTGKRRRNTTKKRRKSVVKSHGPQCAYCGIIVQGSRLTLDHVVPKVQGGPNTLANIRPCCPECNQSKRDRTPEQWANDIRQVLVDAVTA